MSAEPAHHPAARTAVVIAALLVAATIFFVWGALAERSDHQDNLTTNASQQESGSGETPSEHAAEGTTTESGTEYHPLGINLESTPLIVIAAAASLGLAALVAFRPNAATLLGVVVLGGAFTALEIAEVAHQADRNNTGLVALALIAGILHATAAAVAARELIVSRHALPSATS